LRAIDPFKARLQNIGDASGASPWLEMIPAMGPLDELGQRTAGIIGMHLRAWNKKDFPRLNWATARCSKIRLRKIAGFPELYI
jgi:hypothetical protein